MSTISKILTAPPANFSTTLSANITSSDLTIGVNSVTGLGTEGVGVIYAKDADGEAIVSSIEFIHWTNISGNNLTLTDSGDRGVSGSSSGAQAHNSGDTFEVWVHPSYYPRDFALTEHNDDGTHDDTIVATLTGTQTLTNKTLTSPVLNGDLSGSAILDEDDMASDSDTKVPTQQSVKAYVDAGWSAISDTLTYASATTFTVSGDQTAKYSKGTRIKLSQTSVKYFVVVGSSHSGGTTTVTITGGTDYTLANAAITDPFYSYQANPQGYPGWFNWTPTYGYGSGSFSSVTTTMARFGVIGQMCFFNLYATGTTGGSTGPNITATLPITSANNRSMFTARVSDGGLSLTGTAFLENSTTELTVKRYDGQNWSNGSGRQIEVAGEYRI